MRHYIRPYPTILSIILFIEIVLIAQFSTRIYTVLQRQDKIDELRFLSGELSKKRAELIIKRDYVKSDDYVEDVARGALGYALPGERVYMVAEEAQKQIELSTSEHLSENILPNPSMTWWAENLYSWWNLFFVEKSN